MNGYARGTRFGIRADGTGLLAAGEQGVQLTWMDAKVGDWVVTPRIGKPVEIQALWINALRIAGRRSARWAALASHAQATFVERFWNEERGFLFDVVDSDHKVGVNDASLRPNQIFAIGGLPFPLLEGERARRVVDVVERQLWTPAGLRSLGPNEPGYIGRYRGDMRQRDGAYHQGTVWPWLAGAFVEAWLRVHGDTPENRRAASRSDSSRHSCVTSRRARRDMLPRSPTATRRTRQVAARSRPGRWARRCVSAESVLRSDNGASRARAGDVCPGRVAETPGDSRQSLAGVSDRGRCPRLLHDLGVRVRHGARGSGVARGRGRSVGARSADDDGRAHGAHVDRHRAFPVGTPIGRADESGADADVPSTRTIGAARCGSVRRGAVRRRRVRCAGRRGAGG